MTTKQIIAELRSEIYDKKWYMREYFDKKEFTLGNHEEKVALEGFIEGLEFTINKLKEKHDECL